MWAHFPLRGTQGGGLLGGSGNGISTAGLYLTLGDAESASQAPKMLPWGASSWPIFFPPSDNQTRQSGWGRLLAGGTSKSHSQ